MQKNIGTKDRMVRFIIALLLFVLAFLQKSWIIFLFAIFVLYEAVASWCILYQMLGKNSCDIKKQ